jgi:exodeoxyribonuclease VII large subunit
MSIRHIFENVLLEAISNLQNHSSRLKFATNSLIQFQRSNLDLQKDRLPSLVYRTIKNHHEDLFNKESKTRLLDPIEVLKRGFSYTLYNGKLLQSAKEGKLKGEITTILANGNIKSTITEINNG